MPTLAAQITAAGISAPDYADILQELKIAYWSIYGSDAVLDADSQDGQLLAIFAQAIHDCNQTAIAVYNAYSPGTAQGIGLSSVVKINGIRRLVPTRSTSTVRLVGVVGTVITGGLVGDNLNLGTQWLIPDTTIPIAGQIDVTATCTTDGATTAAIGTLTEILTPTLGWQSVTNLDAATTGSPVESDANLRRRQAASTAVEAQTIVESIYGAVANLNGVVRLLIYVNDTAAPDSNGIPRNSIAVVADGGDIDEIAEQIALKKSPGTGTHGTTSVDVPDSHGIISTIEFYVVTKVPVAVNVTIQSLTGYTSATGDLIKQGVVDYLNSLTIGEDSYLARLYTPANLGGTGVGATFVVTTLEQGRDGDPPAAADVVIAFNEAVTCVIDDVDLTVT